MLGQERRDSSFTATILALLMVVTSLSPLAMAEDIANDDLEGFVGDLSGFDPITEGKEYLFSESPFPISVSYTHLTLPTNREV